MKSFLASVAVVLLMGYLVVAVVDPICQQPAETGPCKASFPKFAFDNTYGRCVAFTYGGCDGNENRFDTEEECQQRCESTITGCWYKGVEHPANSSYQQECNTCFCTGNNQGYCTLMGCVSLP